MLWMKAVTRNILDRWGGLSCVSRIATERLQRTRSKSKPMVLDDVLSFASDSPIPHARKAGGVMKGRQSGPRGQFIGPYLCPEPTDSIACSILAAHSSPQWMLLRSWKIVNSSPV